MINVYLLLDFRVVHIRFIEGMYLHEFVQNG